MLALLLFVFASAIHSAPNDPRQFGPEGIVVSDQTSGQYALSILAPHNIRIVWQNGYGDNPDLGMQVLDATGRKLGGPRGIVIPRLGIQTQPEQLSRNLVFQESADGRNWRVMLATVSAPEIACRVLSEEFGSIAEVSVLETDLRSIVVCWIRSNDIERRLELCIADRDLVHTITICKGTHAFQDVHMVANGSLVTIVWSDFRDTQHPSVYGQVIDLDSMQSLWPENGLNLAPGISWAWNPEIAPTSDPGYVALAYDEWDGGFTTLCYQIVDYQMNFRFWPPITLSGPSAAIGQHAMAQFGAESFVVWEDDVDLHQAFVNFSGARVSGNQRIGARIDDLVACASDLYAWAVWNDDRLGRIDERIFCQRFDRQHQSQWQESGLRVSTASGPQRAPSVATVSEDPSALVIAWEDYRYHPMVPCVAAQLLK
ncbi:MAG: hypothetical protein HYZ08_01135 [Candidatus Kerfeldbacteria bacterium]|nr:hypothetical protein [Candidatus Kerfeldbacteria bacterium]